ncbi:MarR family transcriptional regulator [Anopheles sinensis]|uniref:MarR family transcriptional regulator n=1 Tax=Anopheles sinensis TaxID=74873 RepID=A0A084WKW6_ANOSI|nr:MarR family transcriptional regulator [Anopheles sinensis]
MSIPWLAVCGKTQQSHFRSVRSIYPPPVLRPAVAPFRREGYADPLVFNSLTTPRSDSIRFPPFERKRKTYVRKGNGRRKRGKHCGSSWALANRFCTPLNGLWNPAASEKKALKALTFSRKLELEKCPCTLRSKGASFLGTIKRKTPGKPNGKPPRKGSVLMENIFFQLLHPESNNPPRDARRQVVFPAASSFGIEFLIFLSIHSTPEVHNLKRRLVVIGSKRRWECVPR